MGDGAAAPHEMAAPVPLAAIPSAAWMEGGDGDDDSASSAASSAGSSASSASSWGDAVSNMDEDEDVDLAAVAAAFAV